MNNELASITTTHLKLPEVWIVGGVFTAPVQGFAKSVTSAATDVINSGAAAKFRY